MKAKLGYAQRFFLTIFLMLIATFVIIPLNFANATMTVEHGSAMHQMKNACQKKVNSNTMMNSKMHAMKGNTMMNSKMHAMKGNTMMNSKMHAMKGRLIAEGKKLFYSKSIGTNGFSCATCHVYSVGTYMEAHGRGAVIMSIKNAAKKVNVSNKMHHTHITLKEKIAMCDRMALRGHMSKSEINALTAYVNSLK